MRALAALSLAACLAALPAQTILIVDAAGGAGSNFTDLPPAVAAAPDGAVLRVRPGRYTPFSFANKGLSIVGETPTGVIVGKGVTPRQQLGPTTAAQPILLKNLTFEVTNLLVAQGLTVANAQGPVIFDHVTLIPYILPSPLFIDLQQCANVQFHHCTLDETDSRGRNPAPPRIRATDSSLEISFSRIQGVIPEPVLTGVGPPGSPALALSRSRCVAVASEFVGVSGAVGCVQFGACNSTSGDGGVGVDLQSSTFFALSTLVSGGSGRDAFSSGGQTVAATDGGDGIHVGAASIARFRGFGPTGGPGGSVNSQPGAPFALSGGGSIDIDATATPSAGEVRGTMARGQTLLFTLYARPNSVAAVLLSYDPTLIALEPFVLGSLLSQHALALGPIQVPASGVANVPLTLGPTWPLGETYYGQFATVEPTGLRIWTTNPFTLHVNH